MIKKINVVFCGSQNHAPVVFRSLTANPSWQIKLAVTGGDKTAPNLIQQLAQEKSVPFAYWNSKEDLPAILEKIQGVAPDFLLVADFGHIVPKELLAVPLYGAVNIHPSLLPQYRGTTPVQAAILNGEAEVGVSLILMDEKMDHGPLLAQGRINTDFSSTSPVLYEKLFKIGASMLPIILEQRRGKPVGFTPPTRRVEEAAVETEAVGFKDKDRGQITYRLFSPPQPQDERQATYTKKLKKEDGKIDWTKPPAIIERMVRAYAGWPGCWTTVDELRSSKLKVKSHKLKVDNRRVKILKAHLNEGKELVIDQLQIEGKKPIGWAEFARGYLQVSPAKV